VTQDVIALVIVCAAAWYMVRKLRGGSGTRPKKRGPDVTVGKLMRTTREKQKH
jgi:hypothetical protein